MAHFFIPTYGKGGSNADLAVEQLGISVLSIDGRGSATFALFGGGPSGERLKVRVYRDGSCVSEGVRPQVTLSSSPGLSKPTKHIYAYSASGLKDGDKIYGETPSGRAWTAALPVASAGDATALMAKWAQEFRAGRNMPGPGLCNIAVPYLAVGQSGKQGTQYPQPLDKGLIGGPMSKIKGLAVHTSAGSSRRTPFQMVEYGMVGWWNKNKANVKASAHFGIAGNGMLVQFIPTSFKAWAQGDPGDQHWISVEIDNDGRSPMEEPQLTSAKRLFAWVCKTYGIPSTLGTGLIGQPQYKIHAEITMQICGAVGAPVAREPIWCAMSEGLSCHNWLKPIKPCPGLGILSQMASITKPGLVS